MVVTDLPQMTSLPMPQGPWGIPAQQIRIQGCMGQPSPQAHLEPAVPEKQSIGPAITLLRLLDGERRITG